MAAMDIEDILSKLSNAEKISLLTGTDFWHTKALPKYGVPAIKVSDGPNGVRGSRFFNGPPAACFPCGTGLAATWDTALLKEAGQLMGHEAIAKGAHVILGPTMNIARTPLGGRGFESFSEDPVLSGLGAAAIVKGIQGTGVQACIKHFVCNDQEHERNAVDVIVTERALREVYLLPFMLCINGSQPGSLMSSYNKVNGTHVSENKKLLTDILRKEWGWDGMIMSDWFGTYSTSEAINAGLDLEMPGPPRLRASLLQGALASNKVTEYTIEQRAREVLKLVKRCAHIGIKEDAEEGTLNTPETAALLRKLAGEAIVLMKNDGNVLPLKKDKSTLILGPNAKFAAYCGGGSAGLPPYYAITPYDGIISKLSEGMTVTYTPGCHAHKELPLIGTQVKTSPTDGKPGMTFRVYNEPPSVPDREAVDDINITKTDVFLVDYYHPKLKSALYYADVEGYLTPEQDGDYEIGLSVFGAGKLYANGELVIDNETEQKQGTLFFGSGTVEERGIIKMEKGKVYHIKLQFESAPASKLSNDAVVAEAGGAFRIGGTWIIDPEKEIEHAVALAKEADQVIICAGLNSDWETEGWDRETMDLPGLMDGLITSVAAANPSTVVIMQSGTPVSMPWISSVPSLIQAWYGGNETGNGIADVLFGDTNPSGKLPLTFPQRVQDNPAFLNFRSERGRTLYGEDVYVGYKFYETVDREVLFPFGHGLSYTEFSMADLEVQQVGEVGEEELLVKVALENTGNVAGSQVVQVYISQLEPSIRRPMKELRGFNKVFLEPGESNEVEVKIALKYATSFWDEARDAWIMEKGGYKVIVSDSSQLVEGNFLETGFEVLKTRWWNGL